MKRIISFFLAVILTASVSGCGRLVNMTVKDEEAFFQVPMYEVGITAPGYFEKVESSGGWDMQLFDGSVYVSLMVYNYSDLAEGTSPKDVYDFQNEDIFSRRENVAVIIEEKGEILNGAVFVGTRYTGEQDGFKNYYDSYLVDMEEHSVFAWVLVTGTPSVIENRTEELKEIVYSVEYTGEAD